MQKIINFILSVLIQSLRYYLVRLIGNLMYKYTPDKLKYAQ